MEKPTIDDSAPGSGFSYERLKLRVLERFNREQQKKVADRSEFRERTNFVAGDPRPGNIRHSRESHVVGNPRRKPNSGNSSGTGKSLFLDKERGKQSPPPYAAVNGGDPRRRTGPETDSVLNPVINLSNWLPGWSAKAKRRQSSKSASPENQETESLYRDPQTQNQKPRIDDSIQESKPQKRRIDTLQIDYSNSSSEAKKLKIVEQREKEGKLGKRSYYREFDDPNKYHKSVIKKEDFTVTKTCQINSKSENITIKHKTKKKISSIGGDSELASTSESHKCGICAKAFSSHQALGGHMSRHNRMMKLVPKPAVNELFKEGQGSDGGGGVSGGSKLVEDENGHQCKVCKKNFPTGQALGGHQRCHWISPPGENPSETNLLALVSTDDAAMVSLDGADGRKLLNLDLNLAPPMVDDEDDSGDGLASSSHNSTD